MLHKVLKIVIGLGMVALFMWLIVNMWVIEARIDKINFVINDYKGDRKSGLTEQKLIEFLIGAGRLESHTQWARFQRFVSPIFIHQEWSHTTI